MRGNPTGTYSPRGHSPVKSDEPPMWLIGFLCLRGSCGPAGGDDVGSFLRVGYGEGC